MKQVDPNIYFEVLRAYWGATRRYPLLLGLTYMQLIGSVVMTVLVPYFASQALGQTSQHGSHFGREVWLLIGSIGIALIFNRIGFTAFMKLQANVMYDLQHVTFTHLMQRGLRFHTNSIGGKLVSDTIDFVGAYNPLTNALFNTGGPLFLTILLGLTVITVSVWQLGAYLAVIVIITLVWAYRESRTRHRLRFQRLDAIKKVVSYVSDCIVNAVTVKTFAGEAREEHTVNALSRNVRILRIRDWTRAGLSGNTRVGFLLLSLLGLILYVHFFIPTTSLGLSIFAFMYSMTLIMRLFDINTLTRQIEEVFLQASPMAKILRESHEVHDASDARELTVTKGEVIFDAVSFAYTDSKTGQMIFSKLNLHIKPGEHVGLVGPSGGGKSTLTRLLMRFEDIQGGAIVIDNQDIRTVTQVSLRSAIGYVPQEPLLFHRTIKENILYGKPRSTMKAVKYAATMAYAADFIEALPDGYDTVVGERGVKLSGGQRQRIAIARAILKNAPILVLDEATSALDSESEALIQQGMSELMHGKTTLVIAHRLSTIKRLDRIIVLDDGKIIEEGTHGELVKKKDGVYARLWQHQSGGFLQE